MIARMLSLTWDIPNGCSTTSVVVIHALKTEAGIAQHNAKCQNLHCLNSIKNNNSFLKFICLTISATYTCNWCLSVTAILTGGLFWIPPPAPVVVYSPWHWVVVEACLGSVKSRRWTVEQKCYILNEKTREIWIIYDFLIFPNHWLFKSWFARVKYVFYLWRLKLSNLHVPRTNLKEYCC